MDISQIIIIAAIILFFIWKFANQVSIAKGRQLVKEGATIVDVRTSEEFSSGHHAGAINIPLGNLEQTIKKEFPDKETVLLLYCASGTRSGWGKSKLKKMGYKNVYNAGSFFRAARIIMD